MLIQHDDIYYESRKPQPDLGSLKNFLRFIWNNEKKAFLDRTCKDWALVSLFYLIFFGVVFSLFTLNMWITMNYIRILQKPYVHQTASTFRSFAEASGNSFFRTSSAGFRNPGIGFTPNILTPTTFPIIWITESNSKTRRERYIRAMNNFLQEYNKNISDFHPECVNRQLQTDFIRKPCFFDIKNLGICGKSPYGYTFPLKPCILIKFNKMFNWIPNYYNGTSELPESMPESLKLIVRSSQKFHIWLSCTGANNIDKEHIGIIKYLPIPGFPVQFFPFNGQQQYLSPIVALQFANLTGKVDPLLVFFNIKN